MSGWGKPSGYDSSPLRGILKLSLESEAEERIAVMRRNLWAITATLVISLGIALWIALRFSVLRPIGQLRDAIRRVGQGDRVAKLMMTQHDELGEVGAVFNTMQEQLNATETRIRAVSDNVVDAIITIDRNGIIDSVNPAVEKIFGYMESEVLGKKINILMPPPYSDEHDDYMEKYLRTGVSSIIGKTRELAGRRKDGSSFPIDLAISEMKVGDALYFIGIVRDITERKQHMAELEYQALHDSLTHLPNRTLLADRLQQAIRSARREEKTLAFLIMDLDRFKEINDTLGHHCGDIILQDVAKRMQSVLRTSDTVARLGGDEFAILLPTADLEHASRLSSKLLHVLEQPFIVEGHTLVIGASIGIALFPTHGEDGGALMRCSDIAMYVAKRAQCGYVAYAPEQDQKSTHYLSLMSELRDALEKDQIVLCYQPVINMQTGRIEGVETLARWQHPEHGLLSPEEFIPLAEQTSLIRVFTLWVLKKAVEQRQVWTKSGITLRVAINLSARNLHDPTFPESVSHILKSSNILADQMRFEIIETDITSDLAHAEEVLKQLKTMGVRISIDDFGSDHSSLAALKKLPVDEIKIDRTFIKGIQEDNYDAAIIRSMIDLAHKIGLQVVAKGLEDRKTFDLLSEWHCDVAQGFYISKPLSSDELVTWMETSPWGDNKA